MSRSAERRVWDGIRNRCNNPNCDCYDRYGGRGIRVCERWGSFANFLADMGNRPSPDHQIERVNNDGPYSPENCVWATRTTQARNRRSSTLITFREETKSIAEWAEVMGIPYRTLQQRLSHYKWEVERAMTTPSLGGPAARMNPKLKDPAITSQIDDMWGQKVSIFAISKHFKINRESIKRYLVRSGKI